MLFTRCADHDTLSCSYGYISMSAATHLVDKRSSLTLQNGDGGTEDGQISFSAILSQGGLQLVNGQYVGANGFKRNWDSCSSTVSLSLTLGA